MSRPREIRISVVGDPGTGKSSLISTAALDTFEVRPPPTLPPTRLPPEFTPDYTAMLICDTSSRPEDQLSVDLAIQTSEVVVCCFDAKKQSSLDSIRSVWYPRIQRLNPDVPVILACCKADTLEHEHDVQVLREVGATQRFQGCMGGNMRA
jgi:Ras family protein T1